MTTFTERRFIKSLGVVVAFCMERIEFRCNGDAFVSLAGHIVCV